MRPARRQTVVSMGIAAVAMLALGACSSASAPAWTYAPPLASPSASAGSSAGASASASAAPAAGASGSPPASASAGASPSASAGAGASGSPGSSAAAITIKAQNIAFDQSSIDATAGQPFSITFDNEDAGVPHNLDIKDSSGASVAKTDISNGPATANLQVPALSAGTYTFVCDVHSNMTGTITVK